MLLGLLTCALCPSPAGIMAILFSGIVMSHYTHHNLSPVTQILMQQTLRTVAFLCGESPLGAGCGLPRAVACPHPILGAGKILPGSRVPRGQTLLCSLALPFCKASLTPRKWDIRSLGF